MFSSLHNFDWGAVEIMPEARYCSISDRGKSISSSTSVVCSPGCGIGFFEGMPGVRDNLGAGEGSNVLDVAHILANQM